jgi:predicted RNA-binding Zn-ribbon protein involved in translation (DUF1610 family)
MTHDTPHNDDDKRMWCDNCGISVEPAEEKSGPTCPSCGEKL